VASGDRSIRHVLEQATPDLCVLETATGGLVNERVLNELEWLSWIRLSAFRSHIPMSGEDQAGNSGVGFDHPSVARSTMVPDSHSDGVRRPPSPSTSRGPPSLERRKSPPTGRIAPSLRMEALREQLSLQGLPEKVVELIVDSNRPATRTAYQSAWVRWRNWCSVRGKDPMSPDVVNLLCYLTSLQEEGLAYSTINIHRSMLSMTLPGETNLGSNVLVKRLMKGVFNRNPPQPKYACTWDVDIVLSYMLLLGSDENMGLKTLSCKLATLLAISVFLRTAELASIDRNSVRFSLDCVSFALLKPRKAQRNGNLKTFSIERNPSGPCVVDCLGFYIYSTDIFRTASNANHLFISWVKPHNPVGASSIGRWIKIFLNEAGIDISVFSAHSTRSAAAASVKAKGIPVERILKLAGWSRSSTFRRFYDKPIADDSL
jgi:Phage integrase family